MVRIVSDSSTMYSSAQAQEAGFFVSPLSVTIAGQSYREYDEITSQQFVEIIRQGHMPTSSQPAVGDVMALYESLAGEEIINISMADGLSGTYKSAVAAAAMDENPERITVVNTRSLCGPHRYMVEQAARLAQAGKSKVEILAWLEERMETAKSYLIPADFGYLRRGGRLSPLVSYVGQVASLAPVMTQTEDGTQLTAAGIKRGFAGAVKHVAKALQAKGVGHGWMVYITHGCDETKAQTAYDLLSKDLPGAKLEIIELSPAFITQGGPSCVAIQTVKE